MKRAVLFCAAFFAGGGVFFGCDEPGALPPAALALPSGCQPLLAGADCTLPFPSDFFRTADATMPSGFRIAFPGATKPATTSGKNADFSDAYPVDGASRVATIVAALPGELVRDGLPTVLEDGTRSARADSASILMSASGAFVPHYTDIAARGNDSLGPAISVRAFFPFAAKTRYIVALRGIKTASGDFAKAPEGFRRLRDRVIDRSLDGIRARFETDIFAPLEKAGVARASLQLAWDFTTGSEELPIKDMLRVRELTLAWLAQNSPQYKIVSVTPGTSPIWREIRGTVTGPMFLESTGPLAKLTRDANGAVTQNATVSFDFLATVPESVRDQGTPARAIALGHGFFGTRNELISGGTPKIAQTLKAVMFSIDWWGMSMPDLDDVATATLQDLTRAPDFMHRVHQAMANWITMTRAIRTLLANDPAFARTTMAPLYDASQVHYFGASNGHILGSTMTALNPEFSRIVLNVGGVALSHMMPRALPFSGLSFIISSVVGDPVRTQLVLASLQGPLDRIDPASYASMLLDKKLSGTPADRRVLVQIGIGDAEVPNCASFLQARMLGLKQTAPGFSVLGVPDAPASSLTSAITLYDFGVDPSVYALPFPPMMNAVHEGVRVDPQALSQMDAFYTNGTIIHPCPGPCKAL